MPVETSAEKILRVAGELFYERGITATGVDAIAAASGSAKTTLYAHYGSKDALVAAYLRARSATWRAWLEAELDRRGGTPRDRLLAIFDVLGEWFLEPGFAGCPFIKASGELCDTQHPGRLATADHRAWVRGLFRSLLRSQAVADPDVLAEQGLLLYDAAMISAHLDGTPDAAAHARNAMAALLADSGRIKFAR